MTSKDFSWKRDGRIELRLTVRDKSCTITARIRPWCAPCDRIVCRSKNIVKRLAIPFAAVFACAVVLHADDLPFRKDLIFLATFDGSAEPAVAANPESYYADELHYSYGVSNMAVVPKGRGYCRYPCEGNIDPKQGTIAMWVRPINWTGAEAGAFVFFALEGKGRMILAKHYRTGGDLFFIIDRTGGEGARVDHDIDAWLPGRWHHVAASWNPKEVALYCDGKLTARAAKAAPAPTAVKDFYVGRTSSSKIGEAALDEVQIYKRPLSPEEVARLYASELKAYAAARRFPAGVERLPVRPVRGAMNIQVGDSRLFHFKGFDNLTGPICLELTARINRRACSQYYSLDLRVNGERVSPFLGNSRSFTRLMNKPFFYTYTAGGEGCW